MSDSSQARRVLVRDGIDCSYSTAADVRAPAYGYLLGCNENFLLAVYLCSDTQSHARVPRGRPLNSLQLLAMVDVDDLALATAGWRRSRPLPYVYPWILHRSHAANRD